MDGSFSKEVEYFLLSIDELIEEETKRLLCIAEYEETIKNSYVVVLA